MKLSLWVTKKCNMNCKYCYEQGLSDEFDMQNDDEYIKSVLDFIVSTCVETDSDKVFIKLFGGEPLLKFNFLKKFLKAANERLDKRIKTYYSITTNGLLINDEIIDWFENNNVECSLSIDGDEETYSINRRLKNGGSPWRKVDEVVNKLVSSNIRISARMTYNSQTFEKLYDNCIYLVKRGFKRIKLVPDYFDYDWSSDHIELLEKEIANILNFREKNTSLYFSLDDENLLIGRKGCAGGYSIFSIDDKGDIYPCTYVVGDDKYKIGNILTDDKIELKYSDSIQHIREDCIGCRYYKCCKAGSCIYGNYKMTGNLYKSNSFFCEYQKLMYRLEGV